MFIGDVLFFCWLYRESIATGKYCFLAFQWAEALGLWASKQDAMVETNGFHRPCSFTTPPPPNAKRKEN